jgi:actin-related protein
MIMMRKIIISYALLESQNKIKNLDRCLFLQSGEGGHRPADEAEQLDHASRRGHSAGGFSRQFHKGTEARATNEVNTRVLAPVKRDIMCCEGGSILASLPSFKNMWITRAEYQEQK